MSRAPIDPVLPMFPTPSHAKGPAEFSPAQTEELQRQRIALKAASPLQGLAEQHDTSDLALFRAVDEQELPL